MDTILDELAYCLQKGMLVEDIAKELGVTVDWVKRVVGADGFAVIVGRARKGKGDVAGDQ